MKKPYFKRSTFHNVNNEQGKSCMLLRNVIIDFTKPLLLGGFGWQLRKQCANRALGTFIPSPIRRLERVIHFFLNGV